MSSSLNGLTEKELAALDEADLSDPASPALGPQGQAAMARLSAAFAAEGLVEGVDLDELGDLPELQQPRPRPPKA